jgi:class 3 adenylate cyclase
VNPPGTRAAGLRELVGRPLRDVSFRVRLLAALVGSVGLLGLTGLLVVGYQTQRQVSWVVQHRAEQTRRALAEVERLRRAELERLVLRVSSSIRIVAALDSAVNGGDASEFAEQVKYELDLAELREGLVRFNDPEGRPVLTLLDRRRIEDRGDDDLMQKVRESPETTATGYRLVQGRLFLVLAHTLTLFEERVGSLSIGFVVDDDVASRLSSIVDAEVCFAAGTCLAASRGTRDNGLAAAMMEAARHDGPAHVTLGGRRLALVPTPLPTARQVSAVIAVPLDDVLAPFERIRRVEVIAAVAALLLALLLGAVLSTQLTAPIRTLVGATERVGRGDYDFQVKVPHRDELGTLAGAFNQMTAGLLLKERYRSLLDTVVSPDVATELLKGELRLGGETRQVTTLFADVRGFTRLTEHLPPESVIGMLNEWLELAATVIAEEGGIVDKYVGDMVMAVFGAPMADPDQALRAVRAAVRLRDVAAEVDNARRLRGDAPFTIGIGVNTGLAVAGNMGSSRRLNYTVLGASVNAANRLCAEANPGEVLIGEATYQEVAAHVVATRLAPRVSKGFSVAVTPYLVSSVVMRSEKERP